MRHHLIAPLLCVAGLLATSDALAARKAVTLDGSSDRAAQRSYQKMFRGRSDAEKLALALAVAKINLEGINSAYELVASPARDDLGITRIRERVNGLSAEQIIALGEQVSSVRIEPATP